jgi:hypothetical protein
MDDDSNDAINKLLQGYEKKFGRLQQQQRLVEDGPTAFGELASRVHAVVERRIAADRRATTRGTPDRRAKATEPADSSPKG